jgi:hypothetical protein
MIGMGAAFDFHLAIADALEWMKKAPGYGHTGPIRPGASVEEISRQRSTLQAFGNIKFSYS